MTLICAYYDEDVPVLIGDLLITSNIKPKKCYSIPTYGDTGNMYPDEYLNYNAGTTRKLVLVSDHLAVCFAGNYLAEKTAAREIFLKFKSQRCTEKRLHSFLKILINDLGSLSLSILGIIVTPEKPKTFFWSTDSPDHVDMCKEYFDGTGADTFKDILARNRKNRVVSSTDINDSFINAGKLLAFMIDNEEHYSGRREDLFGGGFEVISYQDGKLVKLSDFGLMSMIGVYGDDEFKIIRPVGNFYEYTYFVDEVLVIKVYPSRDGNDENLRYTISGNADALEFYILTPFHGVRDSRYTNRIGVGTPIT